MKVMIMVKATKDSEAGTLPSAEMLNEMGAFNEQLIKAGIMVTGDGLHPSSRGYRVQFSGKNRKVVNGPFTATHELVAGFWVWDVKSMEEAIEWVKKCPNPMPGDSEIEIRKFYETEDFAPVDPTGEIRAKQNALRDQLSGAVDAPRFEKGPERVIAGLAGTFTADTRSKIPQLWEKFGPYIGDVPNQVPKVAYGVIWDGAAADFSYMAGVEVKDTARLPSGFTALRLQTQQYAVFTHKTHVSKLSETMDAIYAKWLPKSGYQMAHAPSFERYGEGFNPQTGIGDIELWIPVEK